MKPFDILNYDYESLLEVAKDGIVVVHGSYSEIRAWRDDNRIECSYIGGYQSMGLWYVPNDQIRIEFLLRWS